MCIVFRMMDFVLYIGRRGIKKIGGIFGVGVGDCCSVGEGFVHSLFQVRRQDYCF